jgi:hypothetical protein
MSQLGHFRSYAGCSREIQAQLVHTVDAAAEESKPLSAQLAGARSHIVVPMLKDSELVGVITIYRQEVRPFTDRQIELVRNSATQAVIAIENARPLNELRQRTADLTEALEQKTATSEVLKIISSSPGELEPTFLAMLESAARICEAHNTSIFLRDGDDVLTYAQSGSLPHTPIGYRTPLTPALVTGRATQMRPPTFSPCRTSRLPIPN